MTKAKGKKDKKGKNGAKKGKERKEDSPADGADGAGEEPPGPKCSMVWATKHLARLVPFCGPKALLATLSPVCRHFDGVVSQESRGLWQRIFESCFDGLQSGVPRDLRGSGRGAGTCVVIFRNRFDMRCVVE